MKSGSPFLEVPEGDWLASNDLAFAFLDRFPVSPGHVLVVTRRVVPTWFEATAEEQNALIALVGQVRRILDARLSPKPDGYNVGFNAGTAAGQTVAHVHVHVIPRYLGDVPDPRGGVRYVIPEKANYLVGPVPTVQKGASLSLSTGHPDDPLWRKLDTRIAGATEVDLLASFVQLSGLDVVRDAVFRALDRGARVRILVGDYLYISAPEALSRLHGWMEMAREKWGSTRFEARLVEMERLATRPSSFHPKAWRIVDDSGGMVVVGSSNLSEPALRTGIEWNLVVDRSAHSSVHSELSAAFLWLWKSASPLDAGLVDRYAAQAKASRAISHRPEAKDITPCVPAARPWQVLALDRLRQLRADGYPRALVAVATGMGKTWLAALDAFAVGRELGRRPQVLLVAHRAEILAQTEGVFRIAMAANWPEVRVSWYLGADDSFHGDVVVASVQKLARREGLARLSTRSFDYAVIDEVHHAEAPSYRRILAVLKSTFVVGLTATPERSDGVDVVSLFDDVLACHASIGDGISEGSLVPFHYVGLKDDVDFQEIPWRNGRFDPGVLEQRVENSARMERLWSAWQEYPGGRTIVFCCSRRHALFARDWLRDRGVTAAAIFSGEGGDPRADSINRFEAGDLQALCTVDLFNEGVDFPELDRVVMLRPTESKVVFLQQLGRGLRASPKKARLVVIDFVGNHRVFARRLVHLLALQSNDLGWQGLRDFLDGREPVLPAGCILDVDIEVKEMLSAFLPTGGAVAIEIYRAMRDESARRPSMVELFNRGVLPASIRARFGDWFSFLKAEGDLIEEQLTVFESNAAWFRMLELTQLNRSFKMVVLRVLLDRDALWDGATALDVSAWCRDFLRSHSLLRADLEPNAEINDHLTASLDAWAEWWMRWPLSRWLDDQHGRVWFRIGDGRFRAAFACEPALRSTFESMTSEIVDFRLAQYGRRPGVRSSEAGFVAKVSHSGGRPILFLPDRARNPSLPTGPTEVRLPDETVWIFRMVKVACNVAHPKGESSNKLPDLLRSWFGADAGAPGTGFTVGFDFKDGQWTAEPVRHADAPSAASEAPAAAEPDPEFVMMESPPSGAERAEWVPVYSLEAAAGFWGPENAPVEIGWTRIVGTRPAPGMFVARVNGHSMEPRIRSGSWCLFRPCPAGSREGRILLVQFHSMADPEGGGRYTVKRYHSKKSATEDGWKHEKIELQPLNPRYDTIHVLPGEADDLVVVGEYVASIG